MMDGELGEDLLTEVLVRLPHKSLARFQCVSTTWRVLISGDYLRRRLPLITSGVLFHDGPPRPGKQAYTYACASPSSSAQDGVEDRGGSGVEEADMGFFPCHATSSIIDGCNGLLLYYAAPAAFHVVNPTTRRWAALPAPRQRTLLSVLAFDPCASPHYKVVCFARWLPRGACVEVFDSESGAWRERELDFGIDTDAMSATMHCSGAAIHVLAYSGHVVRIDLAGAGMACAVTALPAPVSYRARAGHCRGRLRYASSDGARLSLWELRDAEGSQSQWALKHELGVRDLVSCDASGTCQSNKTFLFMAFHPEKEVVYLWTPGKLVAFDLEQRRVVGESVFGSDREGTQLIQIWLFPFSRHLASCLA